MAARSEAAWDALSPSYRARLVSAGQSGKLNGRRLSPAQVRRYYLGGGSLAGGRGHAPKATSRPTKATRAPQGATTRPRARKASRRDWSALGDAQRRRYEGWGRKRGLDAEAVRRYYEGGGDLSAARGHRRAAPRPVAEQPEGRPGRPGRAAGQAPQDATAKLNAGELLTDKDRRDLETWRKRNAPTWIPDDRAVMSNETAAQLSQVPFPPDQWTDVQFQFQPDGQVLVVITGADGDAYAFTTDRQGVSEIGYWLKVGGIEGEGLIVRTEGYRGPGPVGRLAS